METERTCYLPKAIGKSTFYNDEHRESSQQHQNLNIQTPS